MECILRHDFDCGLTRVCAWSDYDYSDPETNVVKYLEPGTRATIIRRKFPGVLVQTADGSQYWICEWGCTFDYLGGRIMELEFQTRSEENGIKFFPTLKEAMEYAETNGTVWKISFGLHTGERVRLVFTSSGRWVYEPIV